MQRHNVRRLTLKFFIYRNNSLLQKNTKGGKIFNKCEENGIVPENGIWITLN